MSRRRRRSRYSAGGDYSPPAKPAFRAPEPYRAWRSYTPAVVPYVPFAPRAAPRLVHPARRPTVRPLIRTVRTDTQSPRQSTRRHLDAARRAVLRSRSPSPWTTGPLASFGPDVYVETPPLPRSITCAKRTIRKEVLFALGRTSAGSGAKQRRRNPDSNVRC